MTRTFTAIHQLASAGFVVSLCLIAGCGPHTSSSTGVLASTANAKAGKTEKSSASSNMPQTSWPIFRGDSKATGVSSSHLPKKLSLLWKYEVEGGAFDATPAIVDGVVYIGDADGAMFALNLSNGKEKWKYNFSDKKWIFAEDGLKWEKDETEISGFIAGPGVKDGMVYVGDIFGRFFCLDAEKGEPIWGHGETAEIDAGANFYKGNILFGTQDATLYCLDAKTGKLIWQHAIQDQIRCSPTIVEDRTFVAGCDSQLHIIDLIKGDALDSVPIDSPTMVTPAVFGDYVYFGTEAGALFCVNWREAKVKWTYTDEARSQSFRSSPAVTKDHVVFGGRTKRLYAIDPTSGEEQWKFTAKGGIDSSPVIVGDRVFVGSSDGRVYGLNLKSGEKVWEYEAGGGFAGSPAVAEGRLVIASDRGVVYCFGEKK